MKHAGQGALDRLEPLLGELRGMPALRERSRGVFYRRSQAFLHCHENPAGLFADLRSADGGDFERFRVEPPQEEAALLASARLRLEPAPATRPSRAAAPPPRPPEPAGRRRRPRPPHSSPA